ncbi:MAG: hypothetical protein PHW46_03105, partial [Candidatus Omnitrophica bacterium]|nr:hypothetical protein [Candidatus Omnitrophota bacterium]
MRIFHFLKKLFTSPAIFIITFLAISFSAGVCYLNRNTSLKPGEAGWEGYPDFRVLYNAGAKLSSYISSSEVKVADNDNVYNKNEPFYHFRYSPVTAFVMIPFSYISSPHTALFVWSALIIFVFLFTLLLFVRHMQKTFGLNNTQK